ncbi:MAG: diaminopimelate epimerase [Anaerovibrio sp.]|uniref:diaminopimelate epimerase n=1 Tax=Anaerovibrio sp. TaxID=1872532 RepID=UPI0025F0379C|nr:diaminopimelate epimerase [Anaerovibrio sp.]MCR5176347.1 diaminopimelate epimerase [Anaerovibrio sp.]
MKVHFTKMQGTGNDFILIDCLKESASDYFPAAVKLCDRHYGIGADGILLVLPSKKADFCMRIINADGSEAEMCGNGIRCFARYVYESGLTDREEFTVETGAGILTPKIILNGDTVDMIQVDMGEPILEGDQIPVTGYGSQRIINEAITVKDKTFKMTCVSMGNPHCVVFVDDAEAFPINEYGPLFEVHESFPKKTNTEFAEIKDSSHIRMRVWERGAAITLACGTGSCATLTAAVLNGLTGRKAEIQLDGGKLTVEWADNNHLFMTGPAKNVFTGTIDL